MGKYKGTTIRDVELAFRLYGWDCDIKLTKFNSVRKSYEQIYRSLPKLCLLHIRNYPSHHWTIWFDGKIYDAGCGILDYKEEINRMWFRIMGYARIRTMQEVISELKKAV